jgi:hypothetical protein
MDGIKHSNLIFFVSMHAAVKIHFLISRACKWIQTARMQGMDACGRWAGGQTAVVHGWLGLSVSYGSPELPIASPYIYTRFSSSFIYY